MSTGICQVSPALVSKMTVHGRGRSQARVTTLVLLVHIKQEVQLSWALKQEEYGRPTQIWHTGNFNQLYTVVVCCYIANNDCLIAASVAYWAGLGGKDRPLIPCQYWFPSNLTLSELYSNGRSLLSVIAYFWLDFVSWFVCWEREGDLAFIAPKSVNCYLYLLCWVWTIENCTLW